MYLFKDEQDLSKNWLPQDGVVHYYGKIFKEAEAEEYFHNLMHSIAWRHDEAIIFGKKIITKRKVAWYGNEAFEYTYSKVTRRALKWTEDLLVLKNIVEALTAETYNSCLLNLYHDGNEGMAWHSDKERDLKPNGAIASLSLGAARKFELKHQETKELVSFVLDNGSLLVMKGVTQSHWLHRIAVSKRIHKPRINLTFRTIVTPS